MDANPLAQIPGHGVEGAHHDHQQGHPANPAAETVGEGIDFGDYWAQGMYPQGP